MALVSLIAKMTAKEGQRDELVAAMQAIMSATESEPGTLVYAMNVSTTEPEDVWFYELYTDQDALVTHGGSEAMKAAGPRLGELLAGRPELYFMELAGGKGLPPG
jgi:quinol monooxygenase YgiN